MNQLPQIAGRVLLERDPGLRIELTDSGEWLVAGPDSGRVGHVQELLTSLLPVQPTPVWAGQGTDWWLDQAAALLDGTAEIFGTPDLGEQTPGYDPARLDFDPG